MQTNNGDYVTKSRVNFDNYVVTVNSFIFFFQGEIALIAAQKWHIILRNAPWNE